MLNLTSFLIVMREKLIFPVLALTKVKKICIQMYQGWSPNNPSNLCDDKMETSDFNEVTIDGIEFTKDGEVY